MPSSRLPDRWENYTNIGKVIHGTRIITFKVPLNESLCSRYPDALWFTPDTLLETIKASGNQLGLVIDLTFTTRYYDYRVFTEKDISYEKIFVPGKEVPAPDIVEKFSSVIDEFVSDPDNEGKLVGVHCTHGVNRTGHLVCRYMIDRLNIEPDKAIAAYNEARGYPIERENYLKDLHHKPGEDDTDLPSDQCPLNEDEQLEVKDKNNSASLERKKHRSGSQSKHHHHQENRSWRSQSPRKDRHTNPQDRGWRGDHGTHGDRQRPYSNYDRNNPSHSYDRQRSHPGNQYENYNGGSHGSWRSHTDGYSENYNRPHQERQHFQRDNGQNYGGYNDRRHGNYGDYRNSQRSGNSYHRGNGFRRTNGASGNSYNRGPNNQGNWSLNSDTEYGNFGHRNHGNWSHE